MFIWSLWGPLSLLVELSKVPETYSELLHPFARLSERSVTVSDGWEP